MVFRTVFHRTLQGVVAIYRVWVRCCRGPSKEPRRQREDARAAAPAPTELRASDADRDRTADILRDALAEGRLTAEEHSERVEEVFRAKTVGELEPLVRDLPGEHRGSATRAYQPAPNHPTPGAVPPVADENVVAVLSSATRGAAGE